MAPNDATPYIAPAEGKRPEERTSPDLSTHTRRRRYVPRPFGLHALGIPMVAEVSACRGIRMVLAQASERRCLLASGTLAFHSMWLHYRFSRGGKLVHPLRALSQLLFCCSQNLGVTTFYITAMYTKARDRVHTPACCIPVTPSQRMVNNQLSDRVRY